METSAGTPLKPKRPAYKPMWEQAERELRAVRTLLHSVEDRAVEYARQLATAESDLLTTRKNSRFLGILAIVEALAFISLLLR